MLLYSHWERIDWTEAAQVHDETGHCRKKTVQLVTAGKIGLRYGQARTAPKYKGW